LGCGQIILYYLNISGKVLTSNLRGDEQGLLGLAFHPEFVANRLFFVCYSASTPDWKLSQVG